MAEDVAALLVLAQVDAELEKNAGIIGRARAQLQGFGQGWKNVKQFQGQQQAVQHAHQTLGTAPAANSPYDGKAPGSMFGRLYDRFTGARQHAQAAGGLYNAQQAQNKSMAAANVLHAHGEAVPQLAHPDYHKMDAASYHELQTGPEAWHANPANAAAAQGPQMPGQQAAPAAPQQGMGWMLPAAAGGLALAGGAAYLMGRNRQSDQPQYQGYGYPPYGRYAYAEADEGQEKTALIGAALGHLLGGGVAGHFGTNIAGRASHHGSNVSDVMAHRAFQAGLQGHVLHPTRQAAMEKTFGPESLNAWNAAHATGKHIAQLSPTGQQMAMQALAKGHQIAGLEHATPFLGPINAAVTHHLAGTAPTLQADGMAAKAHARVLDDLTQHIIDPNKEAQRNVFMRGLGHLRGALPALGIGAVDVGLGGGGLGALGHFTINKLRGDVGSSRLGRNIMKDQLHAGATGQELPKWRRMAGEIALSPAFYDAHDLGRSLGASDVTGLPTVMAAAQEKATRQQRLDAQPFMQAAMRGAPQPGAMANPAAGSAQPQEGGGIGRYALPAAGAAAVAGLGYTAYRGSQAADEQAARNQDYFTNAAHQMNTPLPSMTVKAGYDQFSEEKIANIYTPVYPSMQSALSTSLAQQLASKFVGEPIDAAHKVLKKKLYDEPKQEAAFHDAIRGDDMLQEAHRSNPRALEETFSTLKTFAPSIAKNPSATKSFLRQATMSGMHGGGPDFATIRLMAETEKFIQNSKGRGTNQ